MSDLSRSTSCPVITSSGNGKQYARNLRWELDRLEQGLRRSLAISSLYVDNVHCFDLQCEDAKGRQDAGPLSETSSIAGQPFDVRGAVKKKSTMQKMLDKRRQEMFLDSREVAEDIAKFESTLETNRSLPKFMIERISKNTKQRWAATLFETKEEKKAKKKIPMPKIKLAVDLITEDRRYEKYFSRRCPDGLDYLYTATPEIVHPVELLDRWERLSEQEKKQAWLTQLKVA